MDSVRQYLHEIGQYDLLTVDEEIELSKQYVVGRNDPENTCAYINSQKAKEKLINSNLRLVVSIAKRYTNRGMPFLDLIQEGNAGLMKAIERFDYTKGFKLSTYATWWIRQTITRSLNDQMNNIRLPIHINDEIRKMKNTERELTMLLCRKPTLNEIASEMDIPIDRVEELIIYDTHDISIDTPVKDSEQSTVEDFIEDTYSKDINDHMKDVEIKEKIRSLLRYLTPREEKILILRYGLVDGKIRTLDHVGNVFSITRERVRQIENNALRKLEKYARKEELDTFL